MTGRRPGGRTPFRAPGRVASAFSERGERGDPIWGLDVYRVARRVLFVVQADLAHADGLPLENRDQLLASAASISANIAEGYSRPTPADRARFYAYALGSLREANIWYASLSASLGDDTVRERVDMLNRLRRLLFGTLKAAQRESFRKPFRP